MIYRWKSPSKMARDPSKVQYFAPLPPFISRKISFPTFFLSLRLSSWLFVDTCRIFFTHRRIFLFCRFSCKFTDVHQYRALPSDTLVRCQDTAKGGGGGRRQEFPFQRKSVICRYLTEIWAVFLCFLRYIGKKAVFMENGRGFHRVILVAFYWHIWFFSLFIVDLSLFDFTIAIAPSDHHLKTMASP